MAALGIQASFFVKHLTVWGDAHVELFLGRERASRLNPLLSAQAAGVSYSLHSDSPVTTPGPLGSIWAAVGRFSPKGHVLGLEERVTPMEALRAVTLGAAQQGFEEDLRGSLEVGKVADMAVLSSDIVRGMQGALDRGEREGPDIRVRATVMGGVVSFTEEASRHGTAFKVVKGARGQRFHIEDGHLH